jgi:hypothetical protein
MITVLNRQDSVANQYLLELRDKPFSRTGHGLGKTLSGWEN